MQPLPAVAFDVAEALPTEPLPLAAAPALPTASTTAGAVTLVEPAVLFEVVVFTAEPVRTDPAVATKPAVVAPVCDAVAAPSPTPAPVLTWKSVVDEAEPATFPETGCRPVTLYVPVSVTVAHAPASAVPNAVAFPVVSDVLVTVPNVVAVPVTPAEPTEPVLPTLVALEVPAPTARAPAVAVFMDRPEPLPAEDAIAEVETEEPAAVVPVFPCVAAPHEEPLLQAKAEEERASAVAVAIKMRFMLNLCLWLKLR